MVEISQADAVNDRGQHIAAGVSQKTDTDGSLLCRIHTITICALSFFSFIMVAFPLAAGAMIAWLPIEQLVQRSDYIVIASVKTVRVEKVDLKAGITSLKNKLTVIDSLKGNWPLNKPVFLRTIRSDQWIEDNVELPQGDAPVILFLQSRGLQQTRVVNGIQGVWPMANGEPVGAGTGTSVEEIRQLVHKQSNAPIPAEKDF